MTMATSSSPVLPVSLAVRHGRQLWRRLVKDPYHKSAQAIERLRYSSLWDRQLTSDAANAVIMRMLLDQKPCLVGRIGHTEGRIVGESLLRFQHFGRLTRKEAHQYSGIFPVVPELLVEFANIYAASIAQADLLGFWQTTHQARLLAERYPEIPLAPLPALEPYLQASPWSAALKNRRVLVVHPFATSILHQFQLNRSRIFSSSQVLPEFDLQVLAPPQTLAPLTGGYATWLDALDHLVRTVLRHEFDVALLGCGAYGLPLGAAIKDSGKQAIHLGGALQVLFGIRGRRWEKIPAIAALMNDHWVRPSDQETPVSAALVDEGCYW
jgi:hypothetical protein